MGMFNRSNSRLLESIEREMPPEPRRSTSPPLAVDPFEEARDTYRHMQSEIERLRQKNHDLQVSNNSHLAEVNMLREQYQNERRDRARFESIANTLTGQLRAIGAVISDTFRVAAANGLDAAADVDLDTQPVKTDVVEPAEFLERIEPRTPLDKNRL